MTRCPYVLGHCSLLVNRKQRVRQEEAKDDLLASSDLLQAAQPNLLQIPQPGKTPLGNQMHNTQVEGQ